MKKYFISSILAVSVVISTAQSATPVELHLGLSPFLPQVQRKAVAELLPALLLDTGRLPGGSRVVVWDAWNLLTVAEFSIPSLKFDSKQARAPHLTRQLAAAGQWLRAAPLVQADIPTGFAALKTPEWLELISREPAKIQRNVLLLGSPLYLNLTEPTFSMTDARYPADGHLRAASQETVFGLAGKTNRLARTAVHWCFFSEQNWANELHRTSVTRFWGLYMRGQNGVLATFGADLPAAIANAFRRDIAPCGDFVIDPESEKIEMRTAAPRTVPAWFQKINSPNTDAPPAAASEPAKPAVESKPAPLETPLQEEKSAEVISAPPLAALTSEIQEPPAPRPAEVSSPSAVDPAPVPIESPNPLPIQPVSGKIGIGIAWAAEGVDLDLYVQPGSSKRELWFRNTTSREGRYYHDYRNRNVNLDYEYVELNELVHPGEIKVWVNYYKGRAANPSGKVCVHYLGRSFVGDFSIPASRGNQGGDSKRRTTSSYWTELRLQEIAGIVAKP